MTTKINNKPEELKKAAYEQLLNHIVSLLPQTLFLEVSNRFECPGPTGKLVLESDISDDEFDEDSDEEIEILSFLEDEEPSDDLWSAFDEEDEEDDESEEDEGSSYKYLRLDLKSQNVNWVLRRDNYRYIKSIHAMIKDEEQREYYLKAYYCKEGFSSEDKEKTREEQGDTAYYQGVERAIIREINMIGKDITSPYISLPIASGKYFDDEKCIFKFILYRNEGISLKQVLKDNEKNITLEDSLNMINQVLHGIVDLRKYGVWHNDLSPGNIVFVEDKEVGQLSKIIDFGTAFVNDKVHYMDMFTQYFSGEVNADGEQIIYPDVSACARVFLYMHTRDEKVLAMKEALSILLQSVFAECKYKDEFVDLFVRMYEETDKNNQNEEYYADQLTKMMEAEGITISLPGIYHRDDTKYGGEKQLTLRYANGETKIYLGKGDVYCFLPHSDNQTRGRDVLAYLGSSLMDEGIILRIIPRQYTDENGVLCGGYILRNGKELVVDEEGSAFPEVKPGDLIKCRHNESYTCEIKSIKDVK